MVVNNPLIRPYFLGKRGIEKVPWDSYDFWGLMGSDTTWLENNLAVHSVPAYPHTLDLHQLVGKKKVFRKMVIYYGKNKTLRIQTPP